MNDLEEVDVTTGKQVQGYSDLRALLPAPEANGQLLRVTEDISPESGVRGYLRAASAMENDGPAVLFNSVVGYRCKQLLINTHGSWANLSLIFGRNKKTPLKELFYDLSDRWDRYPGKVNWVKNAPCQEHIIRKNINLYDILPLVRINPYDGGFFFSKASVISKDVTEPDNFDTQNIGMYRIQVQGPDTVGLQALPFHDMGIHLRKAEELNKPLPVVICLGAPPTVSFFASSCLAYNESE